MARKTKHYNLDPSVLITGDQLEPILIEVAEQAAFKPETSTENRIAVFDDKGDIKDGGKSIADIEGEVTLDVKYEDSTFSITSTDAVKAAWLEARRRFLVVDVVTTEEPEEGEEPVVSHVYVTMEQMAYVTNTDDMNKDFMFYASTKVNATKHFVKVSYDPEAEEGEEAWSVALVQTL